MTNKTILVTGSAGFIGYHLSKKLLEHNNTVIGIDIINDYYDPNIKMDRNKILKQNPNYHFHQINLADYEALKQIFIKHKIDKICNLAAQAGVRYSLINPHAYEESNLKGFINLIECARHSGVKDFIFASSSSVYGKNQMPEQGFSETDIVDNPISLYAASKKANELIAFTYHHLYGLNCTGLRFFTVYGPYGRPDMACFIFANNITANKPINVFNHGKMFRDFTYIDDIIDGAISALDKAYPYEIFNLGNSQTVELEYFIKLIEENLKKKAEKKYMPMQPGDVKKTFANINKAKKMLNFNPQTKIEQGIKNFINWYKEYYNA